MAAPVAPAASPTPPASRTPPTAPVPPPGSIDPRRPAWREGLDRLRAAAVTEPGKLRAIGAVLAALVVAFGALVAWQVSERSEAASAVTEHSQPLSADAANIYRSLANADATVASGFLIDGPEPRATRVEYDRDIARASRLLVKAARASGGSAPAGAQIDRLNRDLPVYTGLVERARANDRQGLPLGGAYLRHANALMRDRLLPAASSLYEAQSDQLEADYADAKQWPLAALGVGAVAIGALLWAQHRTFRRTNRVFNPGLVAATVATAGALGWLAVGHGVARAGLSESDRHGARSLQVLNAAQIAVLQARSDENLTLVARGAAVVESGPDKDKDAYEVDYGSRMEDLLGAPALASAGRARPDEPAPGPAAAHRDSLLGKAHARADDSGGRDPVAEAIRESWLWHRRHVVTRQTDDRGEYDKAVQQVVEGAGSTDESFDRVVGALQRAIDHEQRQFDRAADDGDGLLAGLPAGAAALALLGAAGAVLGVGRRLAEYR